MFQNSWNFYHVDFKISVPWERYSKVFSSIILLSMKIPQQDRYHFRIFLKNKNEPVNFDETVKYDNI